MSVWFWVRRFFLVLVGAFAIIATVHLLRGRSLAHAATEAAIWATISALVFVGARSMQARRGVHCAVCRDTPETRDQAQTSD